MVSFYGSEYMRRVIHFSTVIGAYQIMKYFALREIDIKEIKDYWCNSPLCSKKSLTSPNRK